MAMVYFFDQPVILTRKKRQRKLPDQLPRSLRFANLPPTLAAFLSSQERQKHRQEGEDDPGGLLNFDSGVHIDGHNSPMRILSNDAQVFMRLGRRGSEDSLSLNGEYSQKQHYHEAVSLAPTILVQLAAILYLFKKQQLDLPRELVNDLEGQYRHLTSQVQYGQYKWQCTENILEELQEQNEAEEEGEEGEGKDQNEKDGDKTEKRKRRKKKLDGGGEGGGSGNELIQPGATGGKTKLSKKSHLRLEAGAGPRRASTFNHQKGAIYSTGDVQTDTPQGARRTSIFNHQKGAIYSTGDVETDTPQAGGGLHQPNFLQVVSFSMSSKACEEKGWILSQTDTDKSLQDKQQRNILEICLERLKESLTQIKIESSRYRELGHDKPLFTRYYGDTKREAQLKYISKKSTVGKFPSFMNNKSLAPRMTPITPDVGKNKLFYHSLHDSSSTAFYLSGNVAVIFSRAGYRMPGAYTLVYEDDEDKTLLASFTPTGQGCCYHLNGLVKFLSTEKKGIIFDAEGAVTKKWDWMLAHKKLSSVVVVTINNQLTLRIQNRNHMTLVFTCHKESVKLHVGQVMTAVEPVTQEELGYLMTDEVFQSRSAEECLRPPPVSPKKKDKKPRSKLNKQQPPTKPVFQISEIAKNLEMEEQTEYNIPAEKELVRLSRKAKYICENWQEHYRIAVGIKSPYLNRITSAVPHHRKRGIRSAQPTMDNNTATTAQENGDKEENTFLLPRATVLPRSPSAPPVAHGQRRPGSVMSTMSRQSRQPTSSPNRLKSATHGDRHLEFDPSVSTGDQRSSTSQSLRSGQLLASTSHTPRTAWGATPTRTVSTPSLSRRKSSPLTGCPVALRAEMLGDTMATCHCSRHKVPSVGDLELNRFLRECVPRAQLIVIAVVSALFPEALPCHDMFTTFYERQQRNRSKPCYQSRTDPYRLLVYDVVTAVHLSGHKQPLLLQRHNAVPGMFLIFAGGKLVFCDHIFNGYGNAKRDFQKQLLQSKQASSMGNYLPADFRFSPSRGRRGLRSAWGGEIGGTGVDRYASSGLPSLITIHCVDKRTQSPDTRASDTPDPHSPERPSRKQGYGDKRHIHTAADFMPPSLKHTNNLVALAL